MIVCAYALSLAGCGSGAPFGDRASSGLVGNLDAHSLSGLSAHPGEPVDSIGWLQNRTAGTVTLESATVLPMKGFRAPKLVGVAVERMGSGGRGMVTGGAWTGWPPNWRHAARLAGYQVRSGGDQWHHSALIEFAVVANGLGRYAVAGVNVTVRTDGGPKTVQVIGPLAFCVSAERRPAPCPDSFTNRAISASRALA